MWNCTNGNTMQTSDSKKTKPLNNIPACMFANLQVYKFQGYKVTRLQVYNFVNCGDNKFEVVISNLVISKLVIS